MSETDTYTMTLELLRSQRDKWLRRYSEAKGKYERAEDALQSLERFVEQLGEGPEPPATAQSAAEPLPFSRMGLTEAIRGYISAKPGPYKTTKIRDALMDGGYPSKSRSRLYASVCATLDRFVDKGELRKRGSGEWELPPENTPASGEAPRPTVHYQGGAAEL